MRFGKEYEINCAITYSAEKTQGEQQLDPMATWPRVYRLVESVEWHIAHTDMRQSFIDDLRQAKEMHGRVVVLDIMGFGSYFPDLQEQYGLCDVGVGVCLGDNRTEEQRSVDADRGIYRVARNILTPQAWEGVDTIFAYHQIQHAHAIIFFPGAGGYSSYITSRVDVFAERIFDPMWERLDPNGGVLHMELPDHIVWHKSNRFQEWFSDVQRLMPEAEYYKSKSSWRMLRLVKTPDSVRLPDLREYLR